MEIYGYKRSYLRTFLTWIFILASGTLVRLIFYWKPHWMLYCAFKRCPLEEADRVLLIDKYNQYFVEKVRCIYGAPAPSSLINRGSFHQADEDEILRCTDDPSVKSAEYGRHTYGSTKQHSSDDINGRPRTTSTRSNKSTTLTGADNEDLSDLEDSRSPNSSPTLEVGDQDEFDDCDKDVMGDIDQFYSTVFCKDYTEPEYQVRFFENKKIRYIWDDEEGNFVRLRGFDKNVTFSKLQSMTKGLSKLESGRRMQLFGENAINIEIQSYFKILFQEVLGPFYIFQLFSITIWFNDDYYYYGTCIIIMSLLSLVSSVIQIRRNQEQLKATVESVDYIKVCRGNDHYEEVESSLIVPGDIVVVPTFNSVLQFDGILINGNVIVNESMLTGESVPVTKTPLPLQNYSKKGTTDTYYDEKEHSKHTLFCGTKVMQTRYYGGVYVKALVIRVGFQTAKGELIRSIMYPKPVDFRFNKQIHKFIGVLACLAFLGFLYSVVLKTRRGADLKTILISALDLITIVIPPALPAAMTIGIIYAQSRLKSKKIFCISPRSINISGCINCVCFDKTGTLTEDCLSFHEVVPLNEATCKFGRPFAEEVMQTNLKQIEREHGLLMDNGDYSPLMICLASCHSLTIIDQKLIGDPLDLQMFEATGWVLEEPDVDDENKFDLLAPSVVRPPRRKRRTPPEEDIYPLSGDSYSSGSSTEDDLSVVGINANQKCQRDVGILRQFPFSSSLQRMSVITRQFSGNQYVVYAKGAPEKIASLCDPKTIPDDFQDVLHGYTRRGFRVLALAYRPLKSGLSYTRMQRATRQDIEKDLRFLGLLTLGNLLKPETIPVINTLNNANIRSIMVTGDNMLTAISVANECGMILNNDKTILLQVEKKNRGGKSPVTSSDNLPSLEPENELKSPVDSTTQSISPLILTVENIQLETRKESDPILMPKSKKGSRPKLIWHHVSGNQSPHESRDVNDQVCIRMLSDAKVHLALTGDTWDVLLRYYPELLNPVCVRGTVFARMAPHQKQQLVEQLQSIQYYVGMCGDGANDSGALRSAHAGISLSDTEASVAAPFTSSNANISCVPILISEGRAALVTAFGILKYMALYSLIQFSSVLLLYTMFTNFTDMQFLYEDLFIIALIVALFGRTEPYPSLDKKAPPSSLLSMTQLASVSIHLALVLFFQIMSLVILKQSLWYIPHGPRYDHELATHDNYAIFAMSSFQCISLAVIFSKGKPYRKSITSNYLLTGSLVIVTVLTLIILLMPAELGIPYISLEVRGVPLDFRVLMILLALLHFVAAFVVERVIVDHFIFKKSDKFLELFGIEPKVSLFESIDRKLESAQWLSTLCSHKEYQ